ncbi:hypothetical protein EYF80_050289 [Liparis tanakae]|uniref:Uncharacterized protein n=1 Tax=Liparis tanakae TaxID=230148 RepID=A0A4Z2FGN2_9TELE|nr:hypothetical protein EYF80_050289 [Liparis tanakae]
MSRQRTIWEKMSTRWPPAFILGSSLSMRTSFPADCTIACSSIMVFTRLGMLAWPAPLARKVKFFSRMAR